MTSSTLALIGFLGIIGASNAALAYFSIRRDRLELRRRINAYGKDAVT